MSSILLCSVAGSPGVTTTAVALAEVWPRPVIVVEADPSKPSSIIPGLMQGQLDNSRGLLPLAVEAQRGGVSGHAMWDQLVPLYKDLDKVGPEHRKYLLAAISNTQAARGMTGFWSELAIVLSQQANTGVDVIIDAGRISPGDSRTPLFQMADSVAVMARPVLSDLAALVDPLAELKIMLSRIGHDEHLGLVLMQSITGNYGSREIEKSLKVPVIGKVGWDPAAAAAYSQGASMGRGQKRSQYLPAIKALGSALEAQVNDRQLKLGQRPSQTEEVSSS